MIAPTPDHSHDAGNTVEPWQEADRWTILRYAAGYFAGGKAEAERAIEAYRKWRVNMGLEAACEEDGR